MSRAPPRRPAPLRPLPPAAGPALSLLAVGLGALAAGLIVFAWPALPGVALTGAERAQGARLVASVGAGLGLLGAAVGRGRAPLTAGLLPVFGLALLASLPVGGRAHVHVGAAWLVIAVAGVIFVLAATRSPLAPALPPALGAAVVAVGLARWAPAPERPPAQGAGPPVVIIALAGAPPDLLDAPPATPGAPPVLHALRSSARIYGAASAPAAGDGAGLAAALGLPPWAGPGAPRLTAALAARGYERAALLGGRAAEPAGLQAEVDVYDAVFVDRLAVGHPLLRALGHRPLRPAAAARPASALLQVWRGLPSPTGPRLLVLQLAELRWPLAGAEAGAPARDAEDRSRLEASLRPLLARVPAEALLILLGTAEPPREARAAAPLSGPRGAPRARVPLLVRAPGLAPGVEPGPVAVEALPAAVLGWLEGGPLALDPGRGGAAAAGAPGGG